MLIKYNKLPVGPHLFSLRVRVRHVGLGLDMFQMSMSYQFHQREISPQNFSHAFI